MRDVVIKAGVYGRRDEKGRVLPVAKGERVKLPDGEAARLVGLGVAAYADAPAQDPGTPPVPPQGGGEDGPPDAGADKLERMQKADLERMAADLGLDVSGAKTKRDLALLIASAETEDADGPSEPEDGDIVR